MTLSDICIRRPVFATVLSLILVLLGLMAYQRLSVREYPNVDVPIVTVNVTYPGASPEIMESQVAGRTWKSPPAASSPKSASSPYWRKPT